MPDARINIKNPVAVALAHRLAALEGKSITATVCDALEDRAARLTSKVKKGAID
ncbi:type II toxin-antitoxin system VapB family antitoxin [Sphingomonas gilva]|nr:type II toxin-antitoxin system VapB family antitoxin [Sphingomonas gilva]